MLEINFINFEIPSGPYLSIVSWSPFFQKKTPIFFKGFIKINCSNTKFDGKEYTAFCNKQSGAGGAAPYSKSIQGDFNEAKLVGHNQLETLPANNFGTASFILLNENEYTLYKNYLKDNYFITTK